MQMPSNGDPVVQAAAEVTSYLEEHKVGPAIEEALEATVSATTVASLRDAVTAIPEVVQVYFGLKGDLLSGQAVDREAGAASVPLHDLRAFRRVSVGAEKLKLSFEIPVETLHLMQPSGEMGLTAGKWTV